METKTEKILEYLTATYRPTAVILYGSYADGTADAHSDFDALVIADGAFTGHDTSVIDGTVLDVFLYTPADVGEGSDPDEFRQICDGRVVLDTDGRGAALLARVRAYVETLPRKTYREKEAELAWCRKMLERAGRKDAEGFFRWHWLLADSLEIWCDLTDRRYEGTKRGLATLAHADAAAYRVYEDALEHFDVASLTAWVECLERAFRETTPEVP